MVLAGHTSALSQGLFSQRPVTCPFAGGIDYPLCLSAFLRVLTHMSSRRAGLMYRKPLASASRASLSGLDRLLAFERAGRAVRQVIPGRFIVSAARAYWQTLTGRLGAASTICLCRRSQRTGCNHYDPTTPTRFCQPVNTVPCPSPWAYISGKAYQCTAFAKARRCWRRRTSNAFYIAL